MQYLKGRMGAHGGSVGCFCSAPILAPTAIAGLCNGAVRCSIGACLHGDPKLHLLGVHHGCSSFT